MVHIPQKKSPGGKPVVECGSNLCSVLRLARRVNRKKIEPFLEGEGDPKAKDAAIEGGRVGDSFLPEIKDEGSHFLPGNNGNPVSPPS